MDKIIFARTLELVNKQLSLSLNDSYTNSILNDISDLLNQFRKSNLSENNAIRLFCRQMNRLMDYNDSISYKLVIEWHISDIMCIINGQISQQLKNDSWERLLNKIEFESKLEQRELQFQEKFGKRKNLNELFCEHHDFFQNYSRKCITFHSKIQIPYLIGNINDLLDKIYEITNVSLPPEKQECLQEKLKHIKIDLDCSNKTLQSYQIDFPRNNNLNNFLPSVKQLKMKTPGQFENIQNVLECNRWIVILGDPGNAKTSLLRWITRVFAEKALRNDKEFIRIPILIRIGEFATWLDSRQTKTLIDYIGEHTWFQEQYCHDKEKKIFKEIINHGHALILLDGLDEIPNVRQREKIVELVRDFIDKYIHAPDFTSAFDDKILRGSTHLHLPTTVETPLPSKSSGNQIIITSRFIGYQLYPIIGPFIKHYTLLSMEYKEAKEFMEKWMVLVERNVIDIFNNEAIQLNEEKIKNLSKKRFNSIESILKTKSKLLISNPSLLSLICTLIFQSSDELHIKSRVELCFHTVQASFSIRNIQKLNILESVFTEFLINLAIYIHLHSQSGLIDEFDVKNLFCLTLKHYDESKNRKELLEYANQLISLLEVNTAFVVQRGLQTYGFQHLSFQEYYVAKFLVRKSSPPEIVKRILSFTVDSRFHESLVLAVGLISFNWSLEDYNEFCNLLVTSTKDYSIPFGTILFFDAFNDLKILPSNSVIFKALNSLFDHPSKLIGSTYLFWNLSQLSDDLIIEWMQSYLKDEKSISKFYQYLEIRRNKKSENSASIQKVPSVIYQQLWSFHDKSVSIEFDIDQVLRGAMIRDNITDQIFNKDFSLYLSSHNSCLLNIHPLILFVIIAVCGGVFYKIEDGMLKISFSTKHMHRESCIFAPIKEYFNNNGEFPSKIEKIINDYHTFLQQSSSSDTSSVIVDTFLALICLQGLSQPSIYRKYQDHQALPLALERFKWSWFHFMLSGQCIYLGTGIASNMTFIESELKTIINRFFSQSNKSDEQNRSFSLACAASLRKLRISDIKCLLDFTNSRDNQVDQQESFVLLNYLPQSLRKLYSCTIISSTDRTDSLPLVVFLSECLKQVDNIIGDNSIRYRTLSTLKPLLIEHALENYGLAIFRRWYSDIEWFIKNPQLCDPFFIQKSFS